MFHMYQNAKFSASKIAINDIMDRLNSPKYDFTHHRSGGKIIKFQQSQALTSHFENFWSIVPKGLRPTYIAKNMSKSQFLGKYFHSV